MTELIPGRFYKATVSGVPDIVIQIDKDGDAITADRVADTFTHDPRSVTNARPLIVLDPESDQVRNFLRVHGEDRSGSYILTNLARQIEAQTKPPRVPEPGLWGVVEASINGQRFRQFYLRDNLKVNAGGGWVAGRG